MGSDRVSAPGRPLGETEQSTTARPLPEVPESLPASIADAHTHLDACGCVTAVEVVDAMSRAAAVGVSAVVTVADDVASAQWAAGAASWHPHLYAAVAVHPTRADTLDDAARALIDGLARDPKVVAIGETGLDHYWAAAAHDLQREAFAWHIDLAKRLGKPLMIHDRDAHDAVFDVLESEGPPEVVIFHCFSGDAEMARRCADQGFVMSFAGPVSFRNAAALQEAARLVPDELLMVETDAPFLTPHPFRGRRNEPFALPYTLRALAKVRSADVEKLCQVVRLTTERVYGIRVN